VTAAAGANGGSWRTDTIPEASVEVYVTFATVTSPDSDSNVGAITLHGSGCAEAATANGVALVLQTKNTGSTYDPLGRQLLCGSLGSAGGGPDNTVAAILIELVNGDKIGIRHERNGTETWIYYLYDIGAGWTVGVAVYADSNVPSFFDDYSTGVLGLGSAWTTTEYDDFGGGPMELFTPQIIRRLV
jgi:hypothetical protein